MKMWRRQLVAASVLAASTAFAADQPYTPKSDDEVLERINVPRLPGTASLAELRSLSAAQPQFLPAALAYARAALELNRREEDPRYLGYAEAALAPWWSKANAPPEVMLLRAALRLARMEVASAEQDLSALIASPAPEGHAARITRAVLRLSQGNPAAAAADCEAAAAYVSALVAQTCAASVQGLSGYAATALAALKAAIASNAGAPLATQLWARGLYGELAARMGLNREARASYAEAVQRMLAAGTTDPGLLAAYADLLLAEGDARAAQDLLSPYQRLDSLLLRLTIAEQILAAAGDTQAATDAAEHTGRLKLRFAEMRQRLDVSHFREQALFELAVLHQPGAALRTVQRSWATLREPIDARIYLQAAEAAGQGAEAAPVLEWLQKTGFEDVRLQALLKRRAAP